MQEIVAVPAEAHSSAAAIAAALSATSPLAFAGARSTLAALSTEVDIHE